MIPDSQDAAADVDAGRMGVLALAVDVIRAPRAAMARIARRPKGRWIAPVIALALVGTPLGVVMAQQETARQAAVIGQAQADASALEGEVPPEIAQAQAAGMQAGGIVAVVLGAVGGLFGAFLAPLVAAGVLHFLSTILGGQQTFSEVFSTTSWARIPLVLRSVVQLVVFGLGSGDPNPAGLAGLVAQAGGGPMAERSYLEPLLAQVELWNLWYLALLVIAVRAVARFPRGRAMVVVGGLVALSVGFGMVGVAMANAASGMFGG